LQDVAIDAGFVHLHTVHKDRTEEAFAACPGEVP
jgi:hypothetical protein